MVISIDPYDEPDQETVESVYEEELKKRGKTRHPQSLLEYGYHSNGCIRSVTTFLGDVADGVELLFYTNGVLQSSIFYENGLKEGFVYTFYSSDIQRSASHYHHNVRNGVEFTFHDNGQLSGRCSYTNGIREGDYWQYSEDGLLEKHGNTSKKEPVGLLTMLLKGVIINESFLSPNRSLWIHKLFNPNSTCSSYDITDIKDSSGVGWTFHDNGEISAIQGTRNGMFQNCRLEYYDNSALKQVEYFVESKIIDRILMFYKSGALERCVKIGSNGRKGESVSYYENGCRKVLTHYRKDVPWWHSSRYSDNGLLSSSIFFWNGRRYGKQRCVDSFGRLQSVCNFWNDQLTKTAISYYDNGKIKRKGKYVKNIKVGIHTDFYSNGQPKHILDYGSYGVLEKSGLYYDEKSGQRIEEAQFEKGMMQWNISIYGKNNKKQCELNLINQDIRGNCKLFDSNGNIQTVYEISTFGVVELIREFDEKGNCTEEINNNMVNYVGTKYDIRSRSYFLALMQENSSLTPEYYVDYEC